MFFFLNVFYYLLNVFFFFLNVFFTDRTDRIYFANAISLGTHFYCLYPCNTLIVLDVSSSMPTFWVHARASSWIQRYTWK